MTYEEAKNQIVTERGHAEAAAREAFGEALRESPDLYAAEKALRASVMRGESDKEIAALTGKRDALIASLGYKREDFFPPYSCAKCRDTGFNNGKYCDCVKKRALQGGGVFAPPACFFKDAQPVMAGKRNVTQLAVKYAEKFPNINNLIMLLTGSVGTGKTFTAACIANELLAKDYSVTFTSAFKFNDACLKYHTTFGEERAYMLDPFTECDLLIIDDLGTEPILKNVTVEYLYTIINERLLAKKHTIITTNLDNTGIGTRYGERILSRLVSDLSLLIGLSGGDLRKRK